jgi:ferric-dicitrate binding protein FerR (iron transport regulator)
MREEKLNALLSMALRPKQPPQALKGRLMAAVASPALELRRSEGRVTLDDGVVSTGKGASAELRVKGQALIALKENSLATLRRGLNGLELLLEKGGALVNVVPGIPFTSTLPLGLVQVKGTWFYVESRGPKESYLCLCEGRLLLRAEGLRKELVSQDHLAMTLSRKNGTSRLAPADPGHWHPDTGDVD